MPKNFLETRRADRQQLLDWLHKHGPATAKEIAEATGTPYKTILGRLARMRVHEEIGVETHRHNANLYTPLVKTTMPQYPVGDARARNEAKAANIEYVRHPVKRAPDGPWSTIHLGTEGAQSRSGHGGQGAFGVSPRSGTILEVNG